VGEIRTWIRKNSVKQTGEKLFKEEGTKISKKKKTPVKAKVAPTKKKKKVVTEFNTKLKIYRNMFDNVDQGSIFIAYVRGRWILETAAKNFTDPSKCHTGFFNLAIAVCLKKGEKHVISHMNGQDDNLSFYEYLNKFGRKKDNVSSNKLPQGKTTFNQGQNDNSQVKHVS